MVPSAGCGIGDSPSRTKTGRVYRLVGIAEDITERTIGGRCLEAGEDRIRLTIDTMPTCLNHSADGIVDFLNQRWMDYAGLSLEQYVKDRRVPSSRGRPKSH